MPKSCSNHFAEKKEACNLPATDDLKSSAACTTVAVGLRRNPGFGHRIGCYRRMALSRGQRRSLKHCRSSARDKIICCCVPSLTAKPAWLTVDSGAPVSAIALNRRQYFKLKPITSESSLPARVQINGAFNNVAIARELRIGGLSLVDEPVVTVDLGGSARAARMAHEPQIDGIIGADILFPTQAVLDCERQLLILKTDPNVLGSFPGFNRRGLRAVPIQVSDGYNLYVNGAVNGTAAKLMVDTGSFTTLLHRSFVRRMRIATRETPYSSSAVNLKERGVRVANIRKLTVGSVNIMGKDVGVIDLEGLIHDGLLEGSPPVAGLLGAETLRRHHGIIDFGTRTLYLR